MIGFVIWFVIRFVQGAGRFRQTSDYRIPRAGVFLLAELTRGPHFTQVLERESARVEAGVLVDHASDGPDADRAEHDDHEQGRQPGQNLAEQRTAARYICKCQWDVHDRTLRRAHLSPVFFVVFFFVVVFLAVDCFDVFFRVFAAVPPPWAARISFHASAGISSMAALAITRSAAFCS